MGNFRDTGKDQSSDNHPLLVEKQLHSQSFLQFLYPSSTAKMMGWTHLESRLLTLQCMLGNSIVEKRVFLKPCVPGPATLLLKNLVTACKNEDCCVEDEKFKNERVTIPKFLSKFCDFKALTEKNLAHFNTLYAVFNYVSQSMLNLTRIVENVWYPLLYSKTDT